MMRISLDAGLNWTEHEYILAASMPQLPSKKGKIQSQFLICISAE